jgi:hypothetical protein
VTARPKQMFFLFSGSAEHRRVAGADGGKDRAPGVPPERMDLAAITSDTAEGGIGAAELPQTPFRRR